MTQSHNGRAFRWVQIDRTQDEFEPTDSTKAQFEPDGYVSIGFKIMSIGLRLQTVRIPYGTYEAGSAYRMQPYIRSNARAVDRSLA